MAEIFDLNGDPLPTGWGARGRPQHEATQQNRNRVSMLVAMGWSNVRIAAAMYVDVKTLRKHYYSELRFRDVARDRLNATLATKLWELFLGGSVAAGKEFRALMADNDLAVYGQSVRPEAPAKEVKLGKKEAAKIAAQTPDTGSTLGELMARRQQDRPN